MVRSWPLPSYRTTFIGNNLNVKKRATDKNCYSIFQKANGTMKYMFNPLMTEGFII